jgi:hypothetical protein
MMMSDEPRWDRVEPPPKGEEVIEALRDRVRHLEDRVTWIEAQVAVDRARRGKGADYG